MRSRHAAPTSRVDSRGAIHTAAIAELYFPQGLAVDGNGRIYFSDENNLRIRRLDPAQIFPSGAVNAATYQRGPVAPGEVIAIFGSGLGPAQIAQASLDPSGPSAATSLAGAQIAFDGTAAPLVYVSAAQASAIVPFAVAGINQFNVRVPSGAPSGNSVPIILNIGSVASPGTATLAVT